MTKKPKKTKPDPAAAAELLAAPAVADPAAEKKKPGRPPGKYEPPPESTAELSRCPKCGSTDRDRYTTREEFNVRGEIRGRPYTHVILRRTRCATCLQHRIDRTYENR